MTIDECLKTRPYICTNDIIYNIEPFIHSGEIVYIFGRQKKTLSIYYVELQDYEIIKDNERSCVYHIDKDIFESSFKTLSDDDLVVKDILE